MTTTFSVTYEVSVPPERIAQIEAQIAHVIATVDLPDEAERQVARLQRRMEPERRREPAVMRSHVGQESVYVWECPRCDARESLPHLIASLCDGRVSMHQSCPGCGADVHKEELPMSLDLFRLRTRRTDGVEVQPAKK